MTRRHLVLLALFLVIPSLALAKSKVPVVIVEEAKAVELSDEFTYPARVFPEVNAAVFATVDGVVTEVKAPIGRRVKNKQDLLFIQRNDPMYQYVPVAVSAPVAGVVSSLDVSPGAVVTRGTKLATITDPQRLRIALEVAAADLGDIKTGLKGILSANGKTVDVVVAGVSPVVDPATGTATAELVPTSADKAKLHPGLIGRVTFKVRARKGLRVPEHALVFRGNDTFLRIVDGRKAKQVPVSLGKTHRGLVEIEKGLTEGAQVVVRASGFVADGEEVTIQSDEAKKQ